jgi:hypothetical protein
VMQLLVVRSIIAIMGTSTARRIEGSNGKFAS